MSVSRLSIFTTLTCVVVAPVALALTACGDAGETDDEAMDSEGHELAQGETSLFAETSKPTTPSDPDTASVEVGVRFKSNVAGAIRGVRFYKGAGNGGT